MAHIKLIFWLIKITDFLKQVLDVKIIIGPKAITLGHCSIDNSTPQKSFKIWIWTFYEIEKKSQNIEVVEDRGMSLTDSESCLI